MEKKKLIIVDDEPDFLRNVQAFFAMHDYVCLTAANGQEGLDIIEAEKPDLVVLDILMPNMDGYTMLREIKRRKISVKSIVISAKGRLKDLFELEKVDRFLTKPFDLDALKNTVDELFSEIDAVAEDPQVIGEKKERVLIVDDEAKIGESVKQYLGFNNYDAHVVHSGKEGLDAIEAFNPDIVITDVMMPQMDGYSMVKEIRKTNKKLPIIVITAKEKIRNFIELEGIDGFLLKPFELCELEDKVRALLDGAR